MLYRCYIIILRIYIFIVCIVNYVNVRIWVKMADSQILDWFQVFSLPAPKRHPPRSANLTDPVPAFYHRVIPLDRVRVDNRTAEVSPPLYET